MAGGQCLAHHTLVATNTDDASGLQRLISHAHVTSRLSTDRLRAQHRRNKHMVVLSNECVTAFETPADLKHGLQDARVILHDAAQSLELAVVAQELQGASCLPTTNSTSSLGLGCLKQQWQHGTAT